MKRTIHIYIALCLMLLTTSCGETLDDTYDYEAVKPELSVSETSLSFSGAGQTERIQISGNSYWKASTTSDWLMISNKSGKGNGTLTIQAGINSSTTQSRTGTIIISDSFTEIKITATQSPSDVILKLSQRSLQFSYNSGSASIGVESNVDWTVSSDADWCKASASSNYDQISVNVENNNSYSTRTANITVKAGAVSSVVSVTQGCPNPPVLDALSVSSITKTSAYCMFSFTSKDLIVTRTGVCYSSVETKPTTNDSNVYTSESAYSSTSSHNLSGLKENTTYYVRPYVVTSAGTTYGNAVHFTTLKTNSPGEGDNPTPTY